MRGVFFEELKYDHTSSSEGLWPLSCQQSSNQDIHFSDYSQTLTPLIS